MASKTTSPGRRGADLLVRTLERLGVSTVFSLSGNHIMPVYDALTGSAIRLIHVRHEAACVHMADAHARLSGELGVALVTGGPGHANACAGLFAAQASESPMLLLSGHAGLGELGLGAFQELDQAALAAPMTKASWSVQRAEDLGTDMARAARLARSGRKGPVHVSLPFDVLEAEVDVDPLLPAPGAGDGEAVPLAAEALASVIRLVEEASRPLLLCGPGQGSAASRERLRWLRAHLEVPVLLMESPRGINDPALGAFSEVLAEADLIVLLGKPLDFTLKFGRPPHVGEGAGFVVVDSDIVSVDRIGRLASSRLRFSTIADPEHAVSSLLASEAARAIGKPAWRARVDDAVRYRPAEWASKRASGARPVHPLALCAALQRFVDAHADTLLVCDGGEIGQWPQAAVEAPTRLINGVAGSIGHSLPYALAACALRQRSETPGPVIAWMGDGSAGFHIAEFDTAVRERLPVIAVIGNDACWNAEHQIQLREYGAERAAHCELLPTRYDLVAQGFGAHGEFVDDPAGLDAALERAWQSGLPACVNVMVESCAAPVVRRRSG